MEVLVMDSTGSIECVLCSVCWATLDINTCWSVYLYCVIDGFHTYTMSSMYCYSIITNLVDCHDNGMQWVLYSACWAALDINTHWSAYLRSVSDGYHIYMLYQTLEIDCFSIPARSARDSSSWGCTMVLPLKNPLQGNQPLKFQSQLYTDFKI